MVDKPEDLGKVRVLVYGTLKTNGANAPLMKKIHATFMGFDEVKGPFKMLDLGPFPAVIYDKNINRTVRGEMYMMNEEALAHIDFLEGHPHFFKRSKEWTTGEDRRRVWLYTLQDSTGIDTSRYNELQMWEPCEEEINHWLDSDIPF